MTEDIETGVVHTGDCLDVLPSLPDSSVHMVMTSPPYYNLRDYGEDVEATFGGDPDCSHEWVTKTLASQGGHNTEENPPDVGGNSHTQETRLRGGGVESEMCERCGAWHGQLGLEPDARLYVQHIVEVLDAVKRVLRPDGSLWLNLGDTYDTDGDGLGAGRKNKMLVPHRVAIALQESGWVVRNDVTWVKPNPMPSSVKDRLNTTTEQIFHLTPAPDYWYDLDAIREPYAESYQNRAASGYQHKHGDAADGWAEGDHGHAANHNVGGILDESGEYGDMMHPAGKNPGDVFQVTTKPFPDAHFAVYPPELTEKPIKATAPPKVCAACGAPYKRDVDREPGEYDYSERGGQVGNGQQASGAQLSPPGAEFNGWEQTCDCNTDATEPGIVLDPFAGAGTTLLKAKELGRRFVGIELNPEYADMARARVGLSPNDPSNVRDDDAQEGLEVYTDD